MVEPDPIEERSRELFQDSVERLDARTRSRLNQARHLALNELKEPSLRRYWLGAPLVVAASVLMAVLLMNGHEAVLTPGDSDTFSLDDLDIVADDDSFEMIREVEFYSWLADEGVGSSYNSG